MFGTVILKASTKYPIFKFLERKWRVRRNNDGLSAETTDHDVRHSYKEYTALKKKLFNITRSNLFDLLLGSLVIALPLYVAISVKTDWVWLLFSAFYIVVFIVVAKQNSKYFRTVVLTLSMLPYLFFNILLFVNYCLQGSRFNEAFYYHFNKQGIYGHEDKVFMSIAVAVMYCLLLCFLTFKLHGRKTRTRPNIFGGTFLVLLALVSPQSLSFANMYLTAHNNLPVSQYLQPTKTINPSKMSGLIEDANNDFDYFTEDKKN